CVYADGSGPLSYQWRKNGANLSDVGNISGATSSALELTCTASSDAGSYDVVVSGFGSVTSTPIAYLALTNGPPAINNQPMSLTQETGTTAGFNVSACGAGILSYHW